MPRARYRTHQVPARASQAVLDVVTRVQRHLEPTLADRFACRVGMCGSCAMTVNGRPRWTCRIQVANVAKDGRLEIGPLANLPVIRELVTDMTPFFEAWQQAGGRFAPSARAAMRSQRSPPASPKRQAADAGIECINCGIRYAACNLALGTALRGEEALDGFLRWTDNPLVKLAEAGLVVLLATHLTGRLRLLALEFLPWRANQKTLLSLAAGVSLALGLLFLVIVV